jgi:hypothetical protein
MIEKEMMMKSKIAFMTIFLMSSATASAEVKLQPLDAAEAYTACQIARSAPMIHLSAYQSEIRNLSTNQRQEAKQYLTRLKSIRLAGLVILKNEVLNPSLNPAKIQMHSRFANLMREMQRVLQGGWKWMVRKALSPVEGWISGDSIVDILKMEDQSFLNKEYYDHQMLQWAREVRRTRPGQINFTKDQRECMNYEENGVPNDFLSLDFILNSIK